MAATKRRRGAGKATAAGGPKTKRAKGALERKESEEDEKGPSSVAGQDEFHIPPPVSQGKWKNKERVLIFSSRGINFRTRHLMKDLRTLMPHSKADTKMDRKDKLFIINEVCEMKNCNKCIFFEAKKKQDLYIWLSNVPHGPSAKFLVQNIHTLAELKMTGNCLRGSRPVLSFDPVFDQKPHYALLKELFIQCLRNVNTLTSCSDIKNDLDGSYVEVAFNKYERNTPQYHPRSQPFVDHVFTFSITDERIWFRNYQIIEDGALVEIGPRFVLNLIKIFQGSFGGQTLYENPHYQSPNMHRRELRLALVDKFREKQNMKQLQKLKSKEDPALIPKDPTEEVFETPAEEKPMEIELVRPEPKMSLKKKKKKVHQRQRKWKKKLGRSRVQN